MPRKTDDQRRNLRRGRRDAPSSPVQLSGFLNPGGQPRALTGDDMAPDVHVPPFPTEVERLIDGPVPLLGQNQTYAFSDEIDVEWEREITFFAAFSSQNGATKLALIGQAFDEKANAWFPLAIVNAAIAAIADPVGGGSQDMYAGVLLSQVIGAGATFEVAVSFAVGPYRKFRLGYAEVGAQSSGTDTVLKVDVTTSQ